MNFPESHSALLQTKGLLSTQMSYNINGGVPPRIRVRVKRRRSKRKLTPTVYILLLILLCMFVGASAFGGVQYLAYGDMYHRDIALAQTGAAHLERAQVLLASLRYNPLNAQVVKQARQEFASAVPAFVQINNDLKTIPGIDTFIPIVGVRLTAVFHLVPVAIELSQAGIGGCNILNLLITRFHNPLNVQQGQGLTMADMGIIDSLFKQLMTELNMATAQINQVNATDVQFNPRLNKMVVTFQREIPTLQAWLEEIDRLLPVLPTLLGIGTPANYLLEVLDSTELRPGGGFIGNYGILTLSEGRLKAVHISDVALLEVPFFRAGKVIPYPPAYSWFRLAPKSWSLRDSNLDADFPTDAHYGEQNYLRLGGTVPVLGVIAITPALVEQMLEITGPIDVTEYHEIVTAQNLIARIEYHELGPVSEGPPTVAASDGFSSFRKHFTALLAKHLLAGVRQLSPSALPKLSQLLVSSLRSKDIQIYFNSSSAENLLHLSHLDAAIQPSDKDSLFVVDANLGATNANNFLVNTLSDQITLDASGTSVHHTTLSYAWIIPGQRYGYSTYRDYIRIYTPPGSILDTQTGLAPIQFSQAFGHRVWAGNFTLLYGHTHIITLVWHMPHAATKDSSGWHYQYLVQRQAGAQWTLHLLITLPSCAVMSNTLGGLKSISRYTSTFTQSLDEDSELGADYTC
jgi:hypothetical protein